MIKRIQLRGISRTPSDRMTDDGGCAESLNVQIEDSESSPIVNARDVTLEKFNLGGNSKNIIFIHKTTSYAHLIGVEDGSIYGYVDSQWQLIESLEGDTVNDITSLGNTLIISRGMKMTYVLFKEGSYHLLGHNIPFPNIFFEAQEIYKEQGDSDSYYFAKEFTSLDSGFKDAYDFSELYWNAPKSHRNDTVSEAYSHEMAAKNFAEYLRNWVDSTISGLGMYARPVLARWSLLLYDGSEIASDPYYINASRYQSAVTSIHGVTNSTVLTAWRSTHISSTLKPYTIVATLFDDVALKDLIDNWSDIVRSVRFYISLDVQMEEMDTVSGAHVGTKKSSTSDAVSSSIVLESDYPSDENLRNAATAFYKIDEIALKDFLERRERTLPFFTNTERAVKETLVAPVIDPRNDTFAKSLKTYNNSLLLANTRIRLCDGPFVIPGHTNADGHVEGVGNEYECIRAFYYLGYTKGAENIVDRTLFYADNEYGTSGLFGEGYGCPISYLYYPSMNCYKVVLEVRNARGATSYYRFNMSLHSALPGSYFYCEKEFYLRDLLTGLDNGKIYIDCEKLDHFDVPVESRYVDSDNKIYMSESSNFYVMSQSQEFSAPVKTVEIATRALSEGQFGQFPIYAFTEDGVWAMPIDEQGKMQTCKPLSRDVLVGNLVLPLDQEVVFVTARGVMLLNGSNIVNLSENMMGRHYKIDDASKAVLERTIYDYLLPTLEDETPFSTFIRKARASYDVAGNRIIFFAEDEVYAYVYRIATQTWHKLALPEGAAFMNTLNSYPDALAVLDSPYIEKLILHDNGSIEMEHFRDAMTDAGYSELIEPLWRHLQVDNENYDMSAYSDEEIAEVQGILDECGMHTSIAENPARGTRVYDYSTNLTQEDMNPETAGSTRCCIVTRPFSLDADDVLKSINAIKVRGSYEKGRVKYILLGSQDGIHFKRLGTLRGKSWKLFRMIIIADLRPYERISWIDVEYDPRFTNRLR